ncbi:MAG: PAC2 family protein [Candidatus Omnitrophica bacterium]|nr:PAC2 family protein [Candidatus Omnitrophota bacterium]
MERSKVRKKPKLKNPYLICAWPGMGEVAFKAARYLIEKLKAEEFAEFLPHDFFYFTASVIQNGILSIPELPYGKFYYWKNPRAKRGGKCEGVDLVIFLSNAQPDLSKAQDYCREIIHAAKNLNVNKVATFASMPQAIDHNQSPAVWFAGTTQQLNNDLKKYGLNLLSEGQISGMNGLFLGMAKKEGLGGFCLLGEIPLYTIQIENPRASYAVLNAMGRILNIEIDFSGLIEQAQVMEEEINKLLDYLKLDSTVGPIGEEDIEKIKKSLTQLTKLPASIKEKIDQLFLAAQSDITKANELKVELDKWNVYKEYEDRFLDLFKKRKDSSN